MKRYASTKVGRILTHFNFEDIVPGIKVYSKEEGFGVVSKTSVTYPYGVDGHFRILLVYVRWNHGHTHSYRHYMLSHITVTEWVTLPKANT